MTAAILGVILVPILDHAVKRALKHNLDAGAVSLGSLGVLRLVESRMWMTHLRGAPGLSAIWMIWIGCATTLVLGVAVGSVPGWCAGVLMGGALSHLIETSMHGRVSDYVCLRFWPPFDLADVGITAGAGGALVAACAAVLG